MDFCFVRQEEVGAEQCRSWMAYEGIAISRIQADMEARANIDMPRGEMTTTDGQKAERTGRMAGREERLLEMQRCDLMWAPTGRWYRWPASRQPLLPCSVTLLVAVPSIICSFRRDLWICGDTGGALSSALGLC